MEDKLNQLMNNIQETNNQEEFLKLGLIDGCITFSHDNHLFYIKDEIIKDLFYSVLKMLWDELDSKTIEHIYHDYFVREFKNFLATNLINHNIITLKDLQNFKRSLQTSPNKEYIMITNIYGFCLKSPNSFIKLGNYILCDYTYFENTYATEHKINNTTTIIKEPTGQIQNCIIIHENILAIDSQKAKFEFNTKVEKFINTMLYCTAYCSEENSKISAKNTNINTHYICIDKQNNTPLFSVSNESIVNPLYDLSQEFFDKNQYEQLFEYIDNINLRELENKLKLAIDWVGQSMRNNNIQQKFTFLCIALETLLSNKPSGIMDYSITYRLKEFAAYLGGETVEERSKIYEKISKLYNKRSEISHAGYSKNLALKDYYDLISIVYKVTKNIRSLISDDFYKCQHLTEHIEKIKGVRLEGTPT